ncbi:MAG TPA: deoxyguanosinetriphosphate triphosphohydrolase [Acidiferrobacteraceae bacterium]|nr:deoxyguanosinetriphosphate triphosphohydrolase [Acidiferrobacteraceae bacterium]HEX20522.1 deoxyguanosinetriphosphate triphosphohydrolase [Acidiferrobacteraceae bacterium]
MPYAPYAALSETSRGRRYAEPRPAYRSEFQRDRDRIIHSAAFRRLEYKTQVFINHEGDLFRTRLTHSIEVAQIGRSIARALNLNEDLTEAIALAHDLGHTPFGHAGQDALNVCMKKFGGFEHNLQSLRVVDALEERYADFPGLNLTFEAREGILKHCSVKNARNYGELGKRFIEKKQPGLEAQLTNLADELAYTNHDVDDGLRYELIDLNALMEIDLFSNHYHDVVGKYPDLASRRCIHETVRRIINTMVVNLIENSSNVIKKASPADIDDVRNHREPLIAYSRELYDSLLQMKHFLRQQLYAHYQVKRMSRKAKEIIQSLFNVFMDDKYLLPPQYLEKVNTRDQDNSDDHKARVIADYIAGMTDRYALREHHRLFGPVEMPS